MCARVTGRSGRRGGGREREKEKERDQRVVVRHGATIIKGKCRDRDSSVTSRGGRNFSPLGTYDSSRCAGCRVTMYGGYALHLLC